MSNVYVLMHYRHTTGNQPVVAHTTHQGADEELAGYSAQDQADMEVVEVDLVED